MQISTPDPATYDAMLDLQLARWHRWERAAATGLFAQADIWDYRNFRAAYVDGELAGWGFTARPTTFPPDWAILSVTVAAAHEGQGIGTALRAELTTTLPGHRRHPRRPGRRPRRAFARRSRGTGATRSSSTASGRRWTSSTSPSRCCRTT